MFHRAINTNSSNEEERQVVTKIWSHEETRAVERQLKMAKKIAEVVVMDVAAKENLHNHHLLLR